MIQGAITGGEEISLDTISVKNLEKSIFQLIKYKEFSSWWISNKFPSVGKTEETGTFFSLLVNW